MAAAQGSGSKSTGRHSRRGRARKKSFFRELAELRPKYFAMPANLSHLGAGTA